MTSKAKKFLIAIGALSLAGLSDAIYLTIKHYSGGSLQCNLLSGCEVVTSSVYSTIAGVPISLAGAIYYATILTLALISISENNISIPNKILLKLSIVGFAVSLFLVYLQVFVIGELCLYCMISATTSTLIFVLSLATLIHSRKVAREVSAEAEAGEQRQDN